MELSKEQPKSQNWMDDFFEDVKKSAKDIERRARRNEELALQEMAKNLDADIETQRKKQEAIEKCNITLNKAWLAQEALKANNIPTDDWIAYRSNFEKTGLYRKIIEVEKRIASLAISGWALDSTGSMILTTDQNNPLAIVKTTKSIDDWIAKNDQYILRAGHDNYIPEIRSIRDINPSRDRYDRKLGSIAYDDNCARESGIESVNGAFELLNVEHKLIPINNSDIDEENKAIREVLCGDFDEKMIQDKISNLVAEKIINPTNKPIMGRSF